MDAAGPHAAAGGAGGDGAHRGGVSDVHVAAAAGEGGHGCWSAAGRLLVGCWSAAGRLLVGCWAGSEDQLGPWCFMPLNEAGGGGGGGGRCGQSGLEAKHAAGGGAAWPPGPGHQAGEVQQVESV